jgi:hypothetical protein
METISIIPPNIIQVFNPKLLSNPYPIFRESSKNLLLVYQYIKSKLEKKCKTPRRIEKFKKLEEEFLKLYEQVIKEEKFKEKTEHHTQRSLYFIKSIDQKDERILGRLSCKQIFNERSINPR